MGAKKVLLVNNNEIFNVEATVKKLNIREVWKKLWWAALRTLQGTLYATWNALFATRVVREIAPGVYEELNAHTIQANGNNIY